jgi:hypothetical protein
MPSSLWSKAAQSRQRALGRRSNWRYYAIVVTADGRDLNELLVSAELREFMGREHRCRMVAIRGDNLRQTQRARLVVGLFIRD